MNDKRIDLFDCEEPVRVLVSETEITGLKTIFTRNDRAVAVLVSADELTALRETLLLSNDEALMQSVRQAEEEASRGNLLLPEDLFVE